MTNRNDIESSGFLLGTIGRLRPYYLTVCNPTWANINCTKTVTTASGTFSIPQYVLEHNCNPSVSEHDLQEARLSFPSGHSSYSTYAFMFLFVSNYRIKSSLIIYFLLSGIF